MKNLANCGATGEFKLVLHGNLKIKVSDIPVGGHFILKNSK